MRRVITGAFASHLPVLNLSIEYTILLDLKLNINLLIIIT